MEGLLANEDKQRLIALHRNAQRLLKPLKVVNPFADQLTFLNDKTRTCRDHKKYLTLIRTVTLLHQYQRPVKTLMHQGKAVHYIEVALSDIDTAIRQLKEIHTATHPAKLERIKTQTDNEKNNEKNKAFDGEEDLRFTLAAESVEEAGRED